jgi:hypothetical protein
MRIEDVKIPDACPLLGTTLDSSGGCMKPNSPSLDRFDSKKGYTADNVWVVSHRANSIKRDASASELATLVENLSKFPSRGRG